MDLLFTHAICHKDYPFSILCSITLFAVVYHKWLHMFKLIKLDTLNMYSYVNYTPIKLLKTTIQKSHFLFKHTPIPNTLLYFQTEKIKFNVRVCGAEYTSQKVNHRKLEKGYNLCKTFPKFTVKFYSLLYK